MKYLNILIAEDEQDICSLLALHLTKEGFNVFKAFNGFQALEIFQEENIDLAILDVMMPILDGFSVLKEIRKNSEIPVIMLTARGEDTDKIMGLDLGADDYVVKPFSAMVLLARVNAQLRRYYKFAQGKNQPTLSIGALYLDKDSCSLYKHKNIVDLNAKEYKIMELLMDNIGKVYTKKQLYEEVWKDSYYGDDNTIMVHISHIRDKIEDNPREPKYLKTIRGIGYKLEKVQNEEI